MSREEIQQEFETLSSISWPDYCELCAREYEAAELSERARAGDSED